MKKGLLVLALLSLVVAVPACKRRNYDDKDRCNPCSWFRCRPKCDEEPRERVREPRKKCRSRCNPCNWFRCKPRCEDEMIEEEEMVPVREEISRERVVREDIAPAAMPARRMMK